MDMQTEKIKTLEGQMLMEVLTHKLRVLSCQQLARELFPEAEKPEREAQKTIQALKKVGLLETQTAVVHPLLTLDEPVFRWTPGDAYPNFPRLGYQLKSRWKLRPNSTLVCRATKKAREILQGTVGGRRTRATELRHDLHVSEMYFNLLRTSPHLAATWVHEDTLLAQGLSHNEGASIPDALVDDDVMEFGGSYKSEKLQSLHSSFGIAPYTIW